MGKMRLDLLGCGVCLTAVDGEKCHRVSARLHLLPLQGIVQPENAGVKKKPTTCYLSRLFRFRPRVVGDEHGTPFPRLQLPLGLCSRKGPPRILTYYGHGPTGIVEGIVRSLRAGLIAVCAPRKEGSSEENCSGSTGTSEAVPSTIYFVCVTLSNVARRNIQSRGTSSVPARQMVPSVRGIWPERTRVPTALIPPIFPQMSLGSA